MVIKGPIVIGYVPSWFLSFSITREYTMTPVIDDDDSPKENLYDEKTKLSPKLIACLGRNAVKTAPSPADGS